MDLIWPGVEESGTSIEPQLYPSCAQIEVESTMTGQLPKGIRIPEDFSKKSPGMSIFSVFLIYLRLEADGSRRNGGIE